MLIPIYLACNSKLYATLIGIPSTIFLIYILNVFIIKCKSTETKFQNNLFMRIVNINSMISFWRKVDAFLKPTPQPNICGFS